MVWLQALVVLGFLLIHLLAEKLKFLETVPRSRWLSLAGGVSVAYVFMHILPELSAAQGEIANLTAVIPWIEHHAYVMALAGLAVFYGLERLVASSKEQDKADSERHNLETSTSLGIFWLHVASFAVYNTLIGYLLVHREDQTFRGLLFFAIAMSLHFVVNDFGLRQDHRKTYHRLGRWVLIAAIVAGWVMGLATKVHEAAIGALFAFLAGGIVLNVLKEELPEERASRFLPFALGTAGYTALMLLL